MIRIIPHLWLPLLLACSMVMSPTTNASEAGRTWVSLKFKDGTIQHGYLISRDEKSIHLVRSGSSTLLPISSLTEESLALLDALPSVPSTQAVSQQMSDLKASIRDSRSPAYVSAVYPARVSSYRIAPTSYSTLYSSYPVCYPYSVHPRSGSVTVRVRF